MIADEFGANATYVGDLLQQFEKNPESVDEEWRAFFETLLSAVEPDSGPKATTSSGSQPDGSGGDGGSAGSQAAAPSAAVEARRKPAPSAEATPRSKPAAQEERIPLRGTGLRV